MSERNSCDRFGIGFAFPQRRAAPRRPSAADRALFVIAATTVALGTACLVVVAQVMQ